VWQARWMLHLAKSEQNVSLAAFSKTMAGVGPLKSIYKDAFRVADTDFPRGCILEHHIFRFFAKMILRDRCSTSHDLASLFVAGAAL